METLFCDTNFYDRFGTASPGALTQGGQSPGELLAQQKPLMPIQASSAVGAPLRWTVASISP